jgi:hypothetical protein
MSFDYALSLFICSFYLFIYIMLIEIPQMADEYLEQTYPEYKLRPKAISRNNAGFYTITNR